MFKLINNKLKGKVTVYIFRIFLTMFDAYHLLKVEQERLSPMELNNKISYFFFVTNSGAYISRK